jgi:hypothetical protein
MDILEEIKTIEQKAKLYIECTSANINLDDFTTGSSWGDFKFCMRYGGKDYDLHKEITELIKKLSQTIDTATEKEKKRQLEIKQKIEWQKTIQQPIQENDSEDIIEGKEEYQREKYLREKRAEYVGGGYLPVYGNMWCEDCAGWDGESHRCECGNRRMCWTDDSDDDNMFDYEAY